MKEKQYLITRICDSASIEYQKHAKIFQFNPCYTIFFTAFCVVREKILLYYTILYEVGENC